MEVILASCGNPDHYQDPDRPMWGCHENCKVEVKSIEEASQICREFVRYFNLGGGNWIGGQVIKNKQIIARIVVTGKIFLPEDKHFSEGSAYWEHELYKL